MESHVDRYKFESFKFLFRIFSCLHIHCIVCTRNESIWCFIKYLNSTRNINRLYFFWSSFWGFGWEKALTLVFKKKLYSFYQCPCNRLRLFTVHSKYGMLHYNENHSRCLRRSLHVDRSNRNRWDFSNRNHGNYRSFYTDILLDRDHNSISFLLHPFGCNESIESRHHMVLCLGFTLNNCGYSINSPVIRLSVLNAKVFLIASPKK